MPTLSTHLLWSLQRVVPPLVTAQPHVQDTHP